jgi:hypothetical protein
VKTIFFGLKIPKMDLTGKSDSPTVLSLRKLTSWNLIDSKVQQSAVVAAHKMAFRSWFLEN